MYTVAQLCELARVYMAGTGTTASRLSIMATGHNRLFERLFEGYDCHAGAVERASDWFDENWPEGVEWPATVKRRSGGRTRLVRRKLARGSRMAGYRQAAIVKVRMDE